MIVRKYASINEHDTCPMSKFCTTISSVPTIQTYTCSGEEQVEDEGNDEPEMYNTRSERK
jgi:hypothetical protein